MPTHHIQLKNTSGTTYDLYPTTSPLSLTLSAQASGTHFDYATTFTNVSSVLFEVDDTQQPTLTLNWPSASNPSWTLVRTSGTTSYTSAVVGTATKFTFEIPSPGRYTIFELDSSGSDTHGLLLQVQRN
jgi:hypothetical protein